MVRYGGAEVLHVAALMGGIASQEAVKFIAKRLVPTSGTVGVNTVKMATCSFNLRLHSTAVCNAQETAE